jgi:hypothetical protein
VILQDGEGRLDQARLKALSAHLTSVTGRSVRISARAAKP